MMRFVLAACFAALAQPVWASCAHDRVTVFGDWGQARFSVTVADDVESRGRGLMFVEEMPLMTGMLFVYDKPQPVSFWMRNTWIPLDMLFVGADGTVQRVHENAIPLDETAIPGGDAVLAVLEINGGLAARLGISEGDYLQHPAFGEKNRVSCEKIEH